MANKRVIDLAELSQTVQEGQYILVDSAGGTGKMNLKQIVDDIAIDPDGTYPDLYAGDLATDKHQTDTIPYLFRPSASVGERAYETIVGASVGWNQLIQNGNFADTSVWSLTGDSFTVSGNVGTVTSNSDAWGRITGNSVQITSGHKYLINAYVKTGANGIKVRTLLAGQYTASPIYGKTLTGDGSTWISYGDIYNATVTNTEYFHVTLSNNTGTFNVKDVMLKDLTAELGTSIADYIYSLEQATTGSGIAWLRSYGFLTDDYLPYNAGTIESVEATAKVVRDANGENAITYPLGSDVLRGLFKLDANNQLYADGDRKAADGTITRYYGTRDYQEGDESLADAITDGTTTVYKLTTQVIEQSTPFTSPQTVYPDGAEEFITENNVPVGHSTDYPYSIKALAEELIDIPDVPSASGTYVLKATRSASGITYAWVTG